MTHFTQHVLATGLLAAAFNGGAAMAQTIKVPPVPQNLEIEEGNVVYLKGHAEGTQNYICLPTASGFAWTFVSPQATLFFDIKLGPIDFRQQITTHFLSPNPEEDGMARPTWQSSIDTSQVWAKMAANGLSTDTNYVAPGAIPWLKLEKVGTQRGPNGGDALAHTTFIQRLNTAGGVAPTEGCSAAENVGKLKQVPYAADYFFYRARQPRW